MRKLFSLKEIVTVIKTEWYWQRDRNAGQWDRTDSQGINPCIYGQLIFDKCAKKPQSGMARCWVNCPHAEERNGPSFYTINKSQSGLMI